VTSQSGLEPLVVQTETSTHLQTHHAVVTVIAIKDPSAFKQDLLGNASGKIHKLLMETTS